MEIFNTPDSSNVKWAGHDGKVLVVMYKNGDEWEYDAPMSEFESLKKAKSVGSFVAGIKKRYGVGRKRD
jgi:hypothetical protein